LTAGGIDTIQIAATYTLLSDHVENLTLLGTTQAFNGTAKLNNVNNAITGNNGNNILSGLGGNDTLKGMGGVDTLIGGVGRDSLFGGAQGDRFKFIAVADSGIAPSTRDYIADFARAGVNGSDKIDLSVIDNHTGLAGNGAFVFVAARGAAATAVAAGQIGYYWSDQVGTVNDRTIIKVNNDADAALEMTIEIQGLIALIATDFVL
jgi:Ca2+-binding RTX toxin-like protein